MRDKNGNLKLGLFGLRCVPQRTAALQSCETIGRVTHLRGHALVFTCELIDFEEALP
jgi:hypothetical protein